MNIFGKISEMKTVVKTVILVVLVSTAFAFRSKGEIVDSSYYGFTVKHEYSVKTVPDSLFKYFYRDIGLWWSSLHTFSGNAANMIIQPKANGCFCEKLADGGSVRHMTVIYVEPGKVVRMIGGLGPLQDMAVNGVMTLNMKPEEGGTKLTVTYTVGGYYAMSLASLAPKVDRVVGDQFEALKVFAEKQ
jgi:hypothetical protein